MQYKYITKVEISRFHKNEEQATFEDITKEFIGDNPLALREDAFNCALTYKNIFNQVSDGGVEKFFAETDQDGLNKEFNISIYFIDAATNGEHKIHSSLAIGSDGDKEIYDAIELRWIFGALVFEYCSLKGQGTSLDLAKEIEIKFLPGNDVLKGIIFPTPWINWDKRKVNDLVL